MFGKGQREEQLQELAWLRTRVAELEAERDRGLRPIAQAEFGLLLPDTSAEGALPALERLLVELELVGHGVIRAAGASMGIAALERGTSAEGLLANARLALEHAQAAGGGRAVLATKKHAESTPATAPQREAIEALAVALLERDSACARPRCCTTSARWRSRTRSSTSRGP